MDGKPEALTADTSCVNLSHLAISYRQHLARPAPCTVICLSKIKKSPANHMKKRLCQSLSVIGILVVWFLLYQTHPDAPPPLGRHEGIGWWGWFDQGQYLKISEQWSRLDFFNPDKYYPPLYPGIVGLLWPLFKRSGYIVLDAGCALLFFLLLTRIFRQYLNRFAVLLAVAFSYGFNRVLFDQWVIPWTTNLSSLLIIVLAWILHRQYRPKQDTVTYIDSIKSQSCSNKNRDLAIAIGICAAMLALRPYEIIPSLVLTLGIGINALNQSLLSAASSQQSDAKGRRWHQLKKAITTLAPILLPASLILAFYIMYNLHTFGSVEPSYSKEINDMGFNFLDIPFKYASLVNDSSLYGIENGHLTHAVPWYPLMLATAIVGAFTLATPIRYLVAASLLSQTSYLAFNDLVPTGLFTFNNIHYFTWSIAVIGTAPFATIANLLKINANSKQDSNYFIAGTGISIGFLWLALSNSKPALMMTTVRPPDWNTVCQHGLVESPESMDTRISASYIKGKSSMPASSPASSRLIILQLPTDSNNNQIHTANADQLDLALNGQKLIYRRDWRLVSKKKNEKNLLAILLQQEVPLSNLKLELVIRSKSNINTQNTCRLYPYQQ
jgi:hypothetical protein